MDIAQKVCRQPSPNPAWKSFNPCYCGYSSKREISGGAKCPTVSFNPCYCGYSSKSVWNSFGWWNFNNVSILVIVDIAQKDASDLSTITKDGCFNPCYCGYSSKSWLRDSLRSQETIVSILVIVDIAQKGNPDGVVALHVGVSILVIVDIAQKVDCEKTTNERTNVFQSLLLWI